MNQPLPPILASRKSGEERFRARGATLDFDLLSFWRWSASDLVGNTARGVLAEYLVARALGLAHEGVRDEWNPVDLETAGGIKIQVKSAAYLQAWYQEQSSRIEFSTKATRSWDAKTNKMSATPTREADVYVFALLAHRDKATLDPMNLDQWEFYVASRAALESYKRSQYSITLKSLRSFGGAGVAYDDLKSEVERCARESRR